jgi:hypothetical protein
MKNTTFGDAIEALKQGKRVAREGWNGKGMFLFLAKGETPVLPDREITIEGIPDHLFDLGDEDCEIRLPYICMKTATGSIVSGWLASQADQLAEDWVIW